MSDLLGSHEPDASAEALLDRLRFVEAVGRSWSPMHPDTYAELRRAHAEAEARYEAIRPVLEVPWEFGDDATAALQAVYGKVLELRVVEPSYAAGVAEDPAPWPACTCPGVCYAHGRFGVGGGGW